VKRIGPELKMPKFKGGETKVPPFLADLYYDIRDRRLLPVILLILVAIVAAPVLLKDEPEEVVPPPAPPAAVNPGAEQAAARTLTVVKSAPGLRDYKQRLKREEPSNPFKQQHTEPVLKGSELNETTTTTTTTESTDGGSSGGSGGQPSGGGGGGGSVRPGQLTFFTFAVNVRISKARTKPNGEVEQTEPEDRERVIAPAPLPSAKEPVVTYMGLGGKKHLPLFMVSEDVTAVFGEGTCVSGTGTCQLIELEPSQPEIFEYGENHVRYKINVLDIVPVVSGKS
jgi:hypothetical protein